MTKGKDFFGKDITDVIEQACNTFQTTQDELDIEVLETGSAGIFGLCKKQAHIRVTRKSVPKMDAEHGEKSTDSGTETKVHEKAGAAEPAGMSEHSNEQPGKNVAAEEKKPDLKPSPEKTDTEEKGKEIVAVSSPYKESEAESAGEVQAEDFAEIQPPDQDTLHSIRQTLTQLLEYMNCPGTAEVTFSSNTVECRITSEHEQDIIGPDGRTLDSLQYLLRKMIARLLPDRVLLAVNVGEFREKRAEELKQKAVELAALVKEDGKTQAIPALNPSERRIVHIALQDDKSVRSRSVGDGLFKKVLIYKPGKNRRGPGRKKRVQHGNRRSND